MRTKVSATGPAAAFERVLEALAAELIESTDEELLEAARELGMVLGMQGSAAFIGLKYSDLSGLNLEDFIRFKRAIEHAMERGELPVARRNRIGTGRSPGASGSAKPSRTAGNESKTPRNGGKGE